MSSQQKSTVFLSPWWSLYALLVLGFPIFALVSYEAPPEDYGAVAPFTLQNQLGQKIDVETIDQPMIVNFIFTRCPNVCPTITAKMAILQEHLREHDVQLISITVDPQYDTPEILFTYAEQFGADSTRWFFLTGEEKYIRSVVEGFQQTYQRVNTDDAVPNIMHSEKFILLDKEAHIRGFFDDDPKGLNQLMRTISAL